MKYEELKLMKVGDTIKYLGKLATIVAFDWGTDMPILIKYGLVDEKELLKYKNEDWEDYMCADNSGNFHWLENKDFEDVESIILVKQINWRSKDGKV